jgi:hypothetical protein
VTIKSLSISTEFGIVKNSSSKPKGYFRSVGNRQERATMTRRNLSIETVPIPALPKPAIDRNH